ncbi:MAG: ROK family protein, partial [Oscillospiraceae bacterium]|nr:ROK family protein [Oscillospiraceae bacterium]
MMKLFVADIGGTEIKYSVMDTDLVIYAKGNVQTPQNSLNSLLDLLQELYESYGGETSGIAISMPGMIDSDKGFCHTGGALAYNQGQPVAELLSQRCGCPVHIDNDGKCAAIAEHMSGSLRGFENGAVFLIGTGVGGGLILKRD